MRSRSDSSSADLDRLQATDDRRDASALTTPSTRSLVQLWDGWLHVMEVLDKAQKLAARSGSPLSQKTLAKPRS